jgi:SAM-dependent methyltransferase
MSDDVLHSVLEDGGPENYKKFAQNYDNYLESINYAIPESTVSNWLSYHPDIRAGGGGRPHRVFDAGCGTGLAAVEIAKLGLPSGVVEVHGGDLSPDMLEIAKTKNVYHDLKVVNLKEELPYEAEWFDSVISTGVFVHGHCGPKCLPNLFRILKKNGYLITTVRGDFYDEVKQEWMDMMEKCNCKLVEKKEIAFHDKLPDKVSGLLLFMLKQ